MTIEEVFPNPTVKSVIFQIRFPALFAMESLIGDFQTKIMEQFPESRQIIRARIIMAEVGADKNGPEQLQEADTGAAKKIWQFESESGTVMNVTRDSLALTSSVHKTYANPEADVRFRDAIQLAVENLLRTTKIPKFRRIGLRYINNCPVPEGGIEEFRRWYDSALPLDRFEMDDALELQLLARVRRGGCHLAFRETLEKKGDDRILTLDFDAYEEGIKAERYLEVSDHLHTLVSEEYERSIKEPVYDYMRQSEDTTHATG